MMSKELLKALVDVLDDLKLRKNFSRVIAPAACAAFIAVFSSLLRVSMCVHQNVFVAKSRLSVQLQFCYMLFIYRIYSSLLIFLDESIKRGK